MIKTQLHQLGTDEPACPKCQGHNAMLHKMGTIFPKFELECRDCGFTIEHDKYEVIHHDNQKDYSDAVLGIRAHTIDPNTIKADVEVTVRHIDEEVQKRCYTNSDTSYDAMIAGPMIQTPEIKGCPLGASFTSAFKACKDLIERIHGESKVTLEIDHVTVRDYSGTGDYETYNTDMKALHKEHKSNR